MADTDPADRFSVAAIEARVVRYADLQPCYNAFIDCRTPGSEAKENFTIIGPGVSENRAQHVHIAEPHGYNIGGARQPPGCVNSQHSHDTAEVFVAHTGTWRFDLGEHGDDAQVMLHPGDTISLPTKTFRGFTNIGDDSGFLWAVLGQDNPGRVTWAPRVFDMAREFGLVLLENGSLIDTAGGEVVPVAARPMSPTTAEQVAALTRYSAQAAERLVVSDHAGHGCAAIIGNGGPLDWEHGFTLARHDLAAGDALVRSTDVGRAQVIFVHRGGLDVAAADGQVRVDEGGTISLPPGYAGTVRASDTTTLFAVQSTG